MKKLLIILLGFSFLFSFAEEGNKSEVQPLIVSLVKAKSFFREQSFIVDFIVPDDTRASFDDLPSIQDATVLVKKRGFTKTGTVIRYQITPHKAGALKIPALSGRSFGKEIFSAAIELQIKEAKKHENVFVEIQFPERDYYVGEGIPVKFVWYSELPFYAYRAVNCQAPFFSDSALSIFQYRNSPQGGDPKTIGLPVSQQRVIARRGEEKRGDKTLHTISFERIITVNQAGKYRFQPVKMLASFLPAKVRPNNRRWTPTYPSYFDNDFFDDDLNKEKYEKYIITSKESFINVLDLPKEGRPQDFTGIVGPFSISASSQETVLKTGEPLTLNLKLSDHPYLELLSLPSFKNNVAINSYFAVNSVQAYPTFSEDALVYTKSIRPLSTDTKAVPALSFSYFDPQSKSYEYVTTNEIPLTVTESEIVTAFDAKLNSKVALKNSVEKSKEGIRHNYSSLQEGNRSWSSPMNLLALAITIPSALFLVFVLATYQQRRDLADPEGAIVRRAFKNFMSKEKSSYKSLELAVRQYFSDKLSLPQNVHSFKDLEPYVEQALKSDDLAELKAFYQNSDRERFKAQQKAPSSNDLAKLVNLIRSINRSLKDV